MEPIDCIHRSISKQYKPIEIIRFRTMVRSTGNTEMTSTAEGPHLSPAIPTTYCLEGCDEDEYIRLVVMFFGVGVRVDVDVVVVAAML